MFKIICFLVSVTLAFCYEYEKDCDGIFCVAVYKPVCANNGATYGNMCELQRAKCKDENIGFFHEGRCISCVTDIACNPRYDPICGTDGKTYMNGCYLSVKKCEKPELAMAHKGRCLNMELQSMEPM